MKLKYIGAGEWHPKWPAQDHEEPNSKVARAKIKSGLYEEVAPKPDKKEEKKA